MNMINLSRTVQLVMLHNGTIVGACNHLCNRVSISALCSFGGINSHQGREECFHFDSIFYLTSQIFPAWALRFFACIYNNIELIRWADWISTCTVGSVTKTNWYKNGMEENIVHILCLGSFVVQSIYLKKIMRFDSILKCNWQYWKMPYPANLNCLFQRR